MRTDLLARALLGATEHPGGAALSDRLIAGTGAGPGRRVVDVGSGAGRTARRLARAGARVVAADLAPRSTGAARRRGVAVLRADAHALPLAAGGFDAVLSECALSTYDDPRRAAVELARLLGPGGRLGLTDVTADPAELPDVLRAALRRLTRPMPVQGYVDLIEAAGLSVSRLEDRRADAAAMTGRLARRLGLAARADPRLRSAAEGARAAQRCVADGRLSYLLLVARHGSGPTP